MITSVVVSDTPDGREWLNLRELAEVGAEERPQGLLIRFETETCASASLQSGVIRQALRRENTKALGQVKNPSDIRSRFEAAVPASLLPNSARQPP